MPKLATGDTFPDFEFHTAKGERPRFGSDSELEKMRAKRERIQAAGIVRGKYEGNELKLPALFVVDKNASVLYAHYAKNIADMPTADELLEKLEE